METARVAHTFARRVEPEQQQFSAGTWHVIEAVFFPFARAPHRIAPLRTKSVE